jgi:predicted RNA binding protein YcfA (HicA-like mRNA interferase family)
MPKLPILPAKELLRLLLRYGCDLKNVRGSHHIILNPKNNKSSTVPIHGNRDIDRAFLADILNQLGVDADGFLEFIKNN